ncbi:7TM diverse intracellular signaling domain-containing protein [Curvibacter gracilis]|uniref:7TM diverse intracellular signaling domain-containing protein n=1 Tax=Curvibacter gracilis TaxID=230310 RepID=UPI00048160B0|nr:7TM diverse intracellular signaling domain-containing protein [Curvibacter gracilis]
MGTFIASWAVSIGVCAGRRWRGWLLGLGLLLALPLKAQTPQPAPPVPWNGLTPPAWHLADGGGAQTPARVMGRFAAGEGAVAQPGERAPLRPAGVHWLAIDLPPVQAPREVVLEVPMADVQRLVFHAPLSDERWSTAEAGALLPVAHWPLAHLSPAFAWTVQPGQNRVYLSIEGRRPVELAWRLWDRSAFERHAQTLHMLWGATLGGLGLLVVLSLVQALQYRNSLPLFFAGTCLALAVTAAAQGGLGAEYLWPDRGGWSERMFEAWQSLAQGFGLLFISRLVRSALAPRWRSASLVLGLLGLVLGVVALSGLALGSVAAGYGALVWLAGCGVAWRAVLRERCLGAMLAGGWLLLGPWQWVSVLRATVWTLPWESVLLRWAPTGLALSLCLLGLALAWRCRLQRDQGVQRQALKRIDSLTGLSSEHVVLERLDHLILRQHRQHRLGSVMRIRIGNLQAIFREAGVPALDAATLQASQCISQVVRRSGDTLARLGNGDFVLLMEGDFKPQGVLDLAQTIIARGLAHPGRLPGGATLRLQVACTAGLFPGCDAQALLQRLGGLLDAMNATASGRALQLLQPGQDPAADAGRSATGPAPLSWSDQLTTSPRA